MDCPHGKRVTTEEVTALLTPTSILLSPALFRTHTTAFPSTSHWWSIQQQFSESLHKNSTQSIDTQFAASCSLFTSHSRCHSVTQLVKLAYLHLGPGYLQLLRYQQRRSIEIWRITHQETPHLHSQTHHPRNSTPLNRFSHPTESLIETLRMSKAIKIKLFHMLRRS